MRCASRGLFIRFNRDETDTSRSGFQRAIDKQNRFCRCNLLREIRRPLVKRHDTHFRFRSEPFFRPGGEAGPHAIIAPQRIAAGENQTLNFALAHQDIDRQRATRSTTSPSTETSETTSGICPTACEEQLRQGSKVRTTASTRFRMPSVNLPFFT